MLTLLVIKLGLKVGLTLSRDLDQISEGNMVTASEGYILHVVPERFTRNHINIAGTLPVVSITCPANVPSLVNRYFIFPVCRDRNRPFASLAMTWFLFSLSS